MTVQSDPGVVFTGTTLYRSAQSPSGAFWRRLINAMKESRERHAHLFIIQFLKNHPEYQGIFEFERGIRDHSLS